MNSVIKIKKVWNKILETRKNRFVRPSKIRIRSNMRFNQN